MQILIVVNDPEDWTLSIPGVELVDARTYLTDPRYAQMRRSRVFNLCRSYRYQSVGYYVSLLAEARGHKPQPSVACIQDMKLVSLMRVYSDEIESVLQAALQPIRGATFTLSIYFGMNMAKRYERLCRELFELFPAPLLRVQFRREGDGWRIGQVAPLPAADMPASHRGFATEAARTYFLRNPKKKRKEAMRYDMAILYSPGEKNKPSNQKAIDRFIKAARGLSIEAEVVDRHSIGQLSAYDALFIRETTSVTHHTYRFSRRARAEGLAVLDDPDSILRCTNKVYLAQLLERHRVATPKTLIVHKDNVDRIIPTLGLPVILKQPDSAFSLGVVKAKDEAQLKSMVAGMLERSELIVAQKFSPTDFDWRVGVIDGQPLYACKYHMAKGHWQIVKQDGAGEADYGNCETMAVEDAPQEVIETALRASQLIGDGLYGVDLKQFAGKTYVIEVNDNPNVDAGFEDSVLKDELYHRIMASFVRRIENP
jgi:glutathione synthase/RimK-type ligase-like ATP-grasp enzyme